MTLRPALAAFLLAASSCLAQGGDGSEILHRAAAEDEPPYLQPAGVENLLLQFIAQESGLDITSITTVKCSATTCEIAYTGSAVNPRTVGGAGGLTERLYMRSQELRILSSSTGTREIAPGAREYFVALQYQPMQDLSEDPEIAARQHARCAAAWRRMTTNPTPADTVREYLAQAAAHVALAAPVLGAAEAERLAQSNGGPVIRECFSILLPPRN